MKSTSHHQESRSHHKESTSHHQQPHPPTVYRENLELRRSGKEKRMNRRWDLDKANPSQRRKKWGKSEKKAWRRKKWSESAKKYYLISSRQEEGKKLIPSWKEQNQSVVIKDQIGSTVPLHCSANLVVIRWIVKRGPEQGNRQLQQSEWVPSLKPKY